MQDITAEKLQLVYSGPALKDGRMPMMALGQGLRGHALLVKRVAQLMYGEQTKFEVEVDPSFESGSLLVPVHILSAVLHDAENLLTFKGAEAFATLLAILSFFKVDAISLYGLFKRFNGRQITASRDIPKVTEINTDIKIELLVRIYNDRDVQTNLRRTLSPLHEDGIDEFQTRRAGTIISTVSKNDLLTADQAEIEDHTKDEEIELEIEKAAWRRNLAWHFHDGTTSFDARIDDDGFWQRVEQGEAFAVGDRMQVHLHTSARRQENGLLKIEKRIPRVILVEHARHMRQINMFSKDEDR